MTLSKRYAGLIAGLLYPAIFEENPLEAVDRTLKQVVDLGAMDATPADFRAAIAEALASRRQLSGLLPQPHPEATVRAYLAEIAARLDAR